MRSGEFYLHQETHQHRDKNNQMLESWPCGSTYYNFIWACSPYLQGLDDLHRCSRSFCLSALSLVLSRKVGVSEFPWPLSTHT